MQPRDFPSSVRNFRRPLRIVGDRPGRCSSDRWSTWKAYKRATECWSSCRARESESVAVQQISDFIRHNCRRAGPTALHIGYLFALRGRSKCSLQRCCGLQPGNAVPIVQWYSNLTLPFLFKWTRHALLRLLSVTWRKTQLTRVSSGSQSLFTLAFEWIYYRSVLRNGWNEKYGKRHGSSFKQWKNWEVTTRTDDFHWFLNGVFLILQLCQR